MNTTARQPVWDHTQDGIKNFYNDLYQYIAQQLSHQVNQEAGFIYNALAQYQQKEALVQDWEFMYDESNHTAFPSYHEQRYALQENLEAYPLHLSNLTLPISHHHHLNLKFINLFKTVTFNNCSFISTEAQEPLSTEGWLHKLYFASCQFNCDVVVSGFEDHSDFDYLFNHCSFTKKVTIDNGRFDLQDHSDENHTNVIPYKAIFNDLQQLARLSIQGLYQNLPLFCKNGQASNINNITIENCKFTCELKLQLDINELIVKNVIFNQLLDISQSKIQNISFEQVVCKSAVSFQNSALGLAAATGSGISFNYVDFIGFVNFRGARFSAALDLINNKFHHQPNFLSASFNEAAAEYTSRETFRIIKHSFNAVGNNIEANRFFAYEMEAYRAELKHHKANGSVKERLLLYINWLISNHGQSYTRALAWWCGIIFITGMVLTNHELQWIRVDFSGPKWWQTPRDIINGIATGFIPFSAIYKGYKHYEAFILVMGLLLSAVTWQLLVALRRHSKK